jgi:hypothetical protein
MFFAKVLLAATALVFVSAAPTTEESLEKVSSDDIWTLNLSDVSY